MSKLCKEGRRRDAREKETSGIVRLIYSGNNARNHKPQVLRRESSTLINTAHKSTKTEKGREYRRERREARGRSMESEKVDRKGWKRGARVGTDGFARRYNISSYSQGGNWLPWWTGG